LLAYEKSMRRNAPPGLAGFFRISQASIRKGTGRILQAEQGARECRIAALCKRPSNAVMRRKKGD